MVNVAGYSVSQDALADGRSEWVRTLTNAAGAGTIDTFDVWVTGVVVPVGTVRVGTVRVGTVRVGGGATDQRYEAAGLLAVSLPPDGAPVDRQTVAEGARRLRAFESSASARDTDPAPR